MRILLASLLAAFCSMAMAHNFMVADIHIAHPWSRALPPNAPTGAAYLIIKNRSIEEDALVSVSSPIASKAELHTHVMMGEVMKMQQVDSVGIAAGGDVTFAPGGNHIMLFGLKQPLVAGESFQLTLVFEKAGAVDVQVNVEADAPLPVHADH